MKANQKEEAKVYQRIGLVQFLLLTGLGLLLCAFTGAICGCGSDSGPPLSRQGEKPAVSAKSRVVKEILPEPPPGAAMPQKPLLGQAGSNVLEVIPPDKPGGRGKTEAEFLAGASAIPQKIDPELFEVIPPDKPGGRGKTEAEVLASASAIPETIDPELFEMIPPDKPGGRGKTEAEFLGERRPAGNRPTEVYQTTPAVPLRKLR